MSIYRCSICGYIYADKKEPCECPFCRTRDAFDEIKKEKITYEFIKDAWERQVAWMNATQYQDRIMLNPDEKVLQGLAKTMIDYLLDDKQAYCPCRILTGKEPADRKIICPCYFYMGEIELQQRCHCSLYITQKYLDSNKK